MLKEIRMPDLGTTVAELRIIRWLKQPGDAVKRGEPLLEVETDKSTMEVESYLAGYLKKIEAEEDKEVVAGDVIAYVGAEDD
jgi:pyruvate/2-oxoglutarate dehydrogenase complex dihydrolipoamide acyltransferase (E2) component